MAYTQKTIGEFPLASMVNNPDLIPIEQGGITKRIPFEQLKTVVPNYGYINHNFDSGDLSGNTLTINHAKNTRLVKVYVVTPAGIVQTIPYTIVDANNVSINFGGDIEAGDWEYLLEYWGGVAAGYPDPVYALASDLAGIDNRLLLAGRVGANPGTNTVFGSKYAGALTMAQSFVSNGVYKVTHNYANINYSVFPSSQLYEGIGDIVCATVEYNANYFIMRMVKDGAAHAGIFNFEMKSNS